MVWNMNFIFHILGIIIIPTDEVHHFSEGLVETANQLDTSDAEGMHAAYDQISLEVDLGVTMRRVGETIT